MKIEIDQNSGFCFGVQKAISKAGELLASGDNFYALGEMVHNHEEVARLTNLGMKTIPATDIDHISNQKILIRSHGEPPETYQKLTENKNTIIDATCPVVLKLQSRVKNSFGEIQKVNGQLIIFGKQGHAEVVGLNGQTGNKAILVSTIDDLQLIDFSRPIELYSQTTMPLDAFNELVDEIKNRAKSDVVTHDTVCRQVSNRVPRLKAFSAKHEVILFVSGKQSSNGKLLYEVCKSINPKTYFVASPDELDKAWFNGVDTVGICGATSTPQWLMEKVRDRLLQLI